MLSHLPSTRNQLTRHAVKKGFRPGRSGAPKLAYFNSQALRMAKAASPLNAWPPAIYTKQLPTCGNGIPSWTFSVSN